MSLQEFRSAAELLAHYKALRIKRDARRPPSKPMTVEIVDSAPPAAELEITGMAILPQILMEIAKKHGLSINDIKSESRTQKLCAARMEFCYRAARDTPASLPKIGHALGNRDHSTIYHSICRFCEIHNVPRPRGLMPRPAWAWPPERVSKLRDFVVANVKYREIAEAMGISPSMVSHAVKRHNLPGRYKTRGGK